MPVHIRASLGDIAPFVFLPGDPERAEWIAEHYFENVRCINQYRKMLGFTGTFRGIPITVQSTGMGGPSAAIVCEELHSLGAQYFIRVGTCGGMNPVLSAGDLILVTAACPIDATSNRIFGGPGYAPTSDFQFLRHAWDVATEKKIHVHAGLVASMDLFYETDPSIYARLSRYGVLAVEMESSTVLTLAARKGIKAASILTVSDVLENNVRASEDVILGGVKNMMDVALEVVSEMIDNE